MWRNQKIAQFVFHLAIENVLFVEIALKTQTTVKIIHLLGLETRNDTAFMQQENKCSKEGKSSSISLNTDTLFRKFSQIGECSLISQF